MRKILTSLLEGMYILEINQSVLALYCGES